MGGISPRRFIANMRVNLGQLRSIRQSPIDLPDNGNKNVLIMISQLERGGAQRVACMIANELADHCNVYLLYGAEPANSYPLDERITRLLLPRFRYDVLSVFSAAYIRTLKKRYKISTSLSLLYTMNKRNVFSKGKERVIVSERNNPKIAYPENYLMTHMLYALADHVVFQTREVQALYGCRTRKHSSILLNPVSVTCLAAPRRKKRIVTAARLHPNKNLEMLIRAFALFEREFPEYTLSIYGEGPLENSLKELSNRLNLKEKVIFHGNVPDIHEQIADAGMFVLSSNTEGMPNALLEAMMMGLPCVSTACTGAKEIIQIGVNGLLVEPGDTDGLAETMAWMAGHPEQAEGMRQNAMKTAAEFDKEKVMEQWQRLILEEK